MARSKILNTVVTYADTSYVVNDLGWQKDPRFELYDTSSKSVIAKSSNPTDFDEIVYGGNDNVSVNEQKERKSKRRNHIAKSN